jgi:tetratricopeptide (TPR) repeat protein
MQKEPTAPVSHDVAMELAQREGVKAVVSGELLPLGQGVVVSARLVAAATGETLVALRETARTVDGIPDAVDRLSAQMRERIGEPLRSIQGDPPLGEVTTGSLEALRKYVQAEWSLDMGDVSTAEALIKEAIALDTTFAMAHRKLGVILTNEDREGEEAREAFTRAYEGRARLPDRERLLAEAAYHTYVTEKLDSAVLAYEAVLDLYPADGIAGNNLAVLYAEQDQKEKAAGLYVQAIERGHAPAIAYTNAVLTLFEIGRPDSARAILDQFRESYPSHPQGIQYAAAMASARFDYPGATVQVQSLLASQEDNPRWRMWGEAELGSYAMVEGRLNEGVERILRARDHQEQAGVRFSDLPRPLLEAVVTASVQLHFLQDPQGAVHTLDQLFGRVEMDSLEPESRGYLDLATLFAQAGRPERAQGLLDTYHRQVPVETRDEESWQAEAGLAEGAVALARGDPDGAVDRIRAAREVVPTCPLCGLLELGEAYEAAAMPDSALTTYQAYLETGSLFRAQMDNLRLHRANLGMARSYEALGQTELAMNSYIRQLELWAQADPGLGFRIRGLIDKVQALRAETLTSSQANRLPIP